jgi:hypothetical protein
MIQHFEVEADEMASFVQKKENKQWIWLEIQQHFAAKGVSSCTQCVVVFQKPGQPTSEPSSIAFATTT